MTYQTTNDFDLTRQDGTYTGATGELVVSDGGTITLPTPTAGEKFGVRALRNDVTLLSNGSIEASTSDRRIDSEGNSVFVSDGTEWYLVSGNEYFGFDIPDTRVEHQYPHDEGSGTTLTDKKGPINGTISGATWTADADAVGGYYLDYDGTDDGTDFADGSWDDFYNSDYTVTAFVRPDATERAYFAHNGDPNNNGWSFEVRVVNSSINLHLVHATIAAADSGLSLTVGAWNFVAARYDVSSNQVKFDVNNSTNTVSLSGMVQPTNGDAAFGYESTTLDNYLNGGMDETTLSATYLTDSEIQTLKDRRPDVP